MKPRLAGGNNPSRNAVSLAAGILIFGALGCNSSASKNILAEKRVAAPNPAGAPAGAPANANNPTTLQDLSGTSECDLAMIRHAPAPFHLSLKKNTPLQNFTWDADVNSDGIEGTFNINGQTQPLHVLATDQHALDMQATMLIAPMPFQDFNMAKTGGTFPVGPDPVNGYDTIKYVVDTRKMDQHGKLGWLAGMNAKDFDVTATGWVTRDTGCLVKFNADLEIDNKDGTADKTHWEGDFVRKQ
jgi:hypothetical protein